MIRRLSIFFLTVAAMLLGVSSVCQAQSQVLLTHHVREATLNGQAQFVQRLPATQSMRIDIVLAVRNQAELDSFLQELYDPSSAFYHRYLTVQEFTARFGPSQQDYDAVVAFAKANGLTVVGGSRDAMDVQLKGSVAAIESAFHVNMGVYTHPTEGRTFYAPDREPTVDLPFQLWHISGLDNYSTPHPLFHHRNPDFSVKSNATTGSGPSASFLGSDMRAAYYEGSALTGSGQNIGLLEYYGFDIADVNTYYKNAGQTRSAAVTGISTDGTSLTCLDSQGCDDTEQTIDITQALGMAPGVTTVYVYVGSTDTAILGAMSSDTPLPLQLSSSWTWTPADPSTDDPYFEKMATQGQSIFQAAGDSGDWKTSTYPSEDAHVICVGGTDLETSSAGGPWSSETAWVDGGGGYYAKDDILIPSWQQISGVINSSNKGSTTYRNGPDVSANANFTFYVCADQTTCTANDYGGTSFAAPMWAAYLALANQQAAANGDAAPGFINPTIYPFGVGSSYDSYFHDITSGSNGFSAVTGYDLATGWGSPNGSALINALTGTAASPSFSISASPSSVSVVRGSSGTSTVTTTVSGGFDSAITLSASGQPTGVTVGFGTNPIAAPGSGSSVVTFTVASTTTTGTYTITIAGTGDSITHTTTVSLTVTAAASGNFTLSASPTSLTIDRSESGTTKITVTPSGGFTGSVTFAATGLPSGVTASFSPNPGTTTSTLTLKASSSATTGTSTVTITGTSGSLSHTTTISLRVRR
ncbi:MAG: S53 family serine peptidase [Candidatus Acidiferrales bacterium]